MSKPAWSWTGDWVGNQPNKDFIKSQKRMEKAHDDEVFERAEKMRKWTQEGVLKRGKR